MICLLERGRLTLTATLSQRRRACVYYVRKIAHKFVFMSKKITTDRLPGVKKNSNTD